MSSFWNERYASVDFVYGTEPNSFFKSSLEKYEPGKLLLPGEGEGRNAVYAASKGWDVTAFDQSEVAMEKAFKLASERGVNINYLLTEAMDFSSIKKFHLIGLVYFHLPSTVRHGFHRLLQQWLKPGGSIILEGFSTKQWGKNSGGPAEENMLFSEEMLMRDFDYLNISMMEEKEISLDEGIEHQGKASVIRMIGTFE